VLKSAETVSDVKKRCQIILEVAAKQADLGEDAAAAETFDLALQAIDKIEEPFFHVYAMCDAAERLSEAGLNAKAQEVLQRAERRAEKISEPDMRQQAIQRARSLISRLRKREG